MKTVKLVTRVGDEILSIGKCHPAEARRLVAQELAVWENGTLRLILRSIHLDMLVQNGHLWTTPQDKGIGDTELQRRRDWFVGFLRVVTPALAKPNRAIGLPTQEEVEEAYAAMNKHPMTFVERPEENPLSEEEVSVFFENAEGPLEEVPWDMWNNEISANMLSQVQAAYGSALRGPDSRWKYLESNSGLPEQVVDRTFSILRTPVKGWWIMEEGTTPKEPAASETPSGYLTVQEADTINRQTIRENLTKKV